MLQCVIKRLLLLSETVVYALQAEKLALSLG